TLPQMLRRVIKVQDSRSVLRKLLLKQAPDPPPAITAPDHPSCTPHALPQRCTPQPRRPHLDVSQDGPQSALLQPGYAVPGARAMLAEAGQHTPFDRAPADLPLGLSPLWPTWHHHTIGPQGQGAGRRLGRQRLGGGVVAPGDG